MGEMTMTAAALPERMKEAQKDALNHWMQRLNA